MARYVAFLRGVSPMNAKMPELKRCFESANFSDVRTLLTSGNVVFTARSASADSLQRRAEAAMRRELPRAFSTFIREATHLQQLIDSDPYAQFELPPEAKRVVSFLRAPIDTPVRLPIGPVPARAPCCRSRRACLVRIRHHRGAGPAALRPAHPGAFPLLDMHVRRLGPGRGSGRHHRRRVD